MTGYQLTFFTQQDRCHASRSLHQWLMDLAQSMGIRGATMSAAQEGIGSDHHRHSARFFELADQPVEITMVVSAAECDSILKRLNDEPGLHLFYSKMPVEFGFIGQAD
jgi:PII-like signaling protein